VGCSRLLRLICWFWPISNSWNKTDSYNSASPLLILGMPEALTSREIDERLERVIAGNREDFLRWINNPAANTFPNSVVAITEHVRDRLRLEYRLRDEEIV
jgi:hypothetical protein